MSYCFIILNIYLKSSKNSRILIASGAFSFLGVFDYYNERAFAYFTTALPKMVNPPGNYREKWESGVELQI